ncbi:class I SAM-dependent methyltransferase [Mesorhizobium atlanticum]
MTSERHYEYELGHSDRELKRLATQAASVDPMTRDYLRRAGLRTGMHVLDVGSGAGNVAFLAAEIIGPTGLVIGSDRSAVALDAARVRAAQRGLENVIFHQCDPATFAFDVSFDAIVGRYVLMFSPDPIEMLRGFRVIFVPVA